jgi:transcriptional regulator
VPTWNYIALEMEGPVRRTDSDGLLGMLETLSERQEARVIGGAPWTMDKMPADKLRAMMGGINGFEMEVRGWRPTLKLSQNKPAEERARVADALEAQGALAIAQLMRSLVDDKGAA